MSPFATASVSKAMQTPSRLRGAVAALGGSVYAAGTGNAPTSANYYAWVICANV